MTKAQTPPLAQPPAMKSDTVQTGGGEQATPEQQQPPLQASIGLPGSAPPPAHQQYSNAHYYTPPMQQQSLPLYPTPYQYYHAHAPFYPPPHTHVYLPWQQQTYPYYAPPQLWPPQHDPNSHPVSGATTKGASVAVPVGAAQEAPQHHFVPPQPRYPYGRQPTTSYTYTSGGVGVPMHDEGSIRVQTSPAKRGSGGGGGGGGGGRRRTSGYANGNGLNGNGSGANTPCKPRMGNSRTGGKDSNASGNAGGLDELARELATSARDAVGRGDEVTIALLLTSWASMLEDCIKRSGSPSTSEPGAGGGGGVATASSTGAAATQPSFDAVFRASGALQICSQSLLFMEGGAASSPDSAVQKALVSLYGFVLYGTERLHRAVARAARRLSSADTPASAGDTTSTQEPTEVDSLVGDLQKTLALDKEQGAHAKHAAVHKVIDVLRNIADDVAAYNGILPTGVVRSGAVNGATATPAGPDPTKVIDRALDSWRRSCARLQGEIAIVVVLERAAASVGSTLAPPPGCSESITAFFADLRRAVLDELEADIKARRSALGDKWWVHVADVEAVKVVSAVEERAAGYLAVVQRAVGEVDAALSNMGLAFGPPQRVPNDRLQPLVRCGAGVAAAIAAHEAALAWCEATARTITGMAVAFRALATTRDGRYKPAADVVAKFQGGIAAAADAVRQVQEWEADAVLGKVVACVEKTATANDSNTAAPTKHKGIRFEEPPRTATAADDDSTAQKRRKPRHARMKSSPDELLHLNVNLAEAEGNTAAEVYGSTSEASDCSPVKASPASVVTVLADDSLPAPACKKPTGAELPVVYEEKPLSSDDEEDSHIVVHHHHDRVEEDESPGRKRGKHARSISVDGIPSFGV